MSKILLVSDIHSNLSALNTVVEDAQVNGAFDAVWSMGDAIGYGPRPNECIERLIELNAVSVVGNHELAAVGQISTDDFNPYARAAAEWTASVLSAKSRRFIDQLERYRTKGRFTLVHGSPRNPVWEYIIDHRVALSNLSSLETPVCLHGHTHLPAAIGFIDGLAAEGNSMPGAPTSLAAGQWFMNPGSVGQPRDGDPRAAYALLDTDSLTVEFFRVEYDIEKTQREMEAAALPDVLIRRLSIGR